VRSFPGTYTRYRDRVARGLPVASASERAAPPVASAAIAAPAAPRVDSPAPVKAGRGRADDMRLRRIENHVEGLQAERADLEQRLLDPELWKDVAGARLVVERLAAVQGAIDGATRDWDVIADRA
jgi:ATP-binding cassette subfamily F protein 3